jgi:hypothetical protein
MKDDPTITRLRQVRRSISEKFNHDPKKIVGHYIEIQKKHKARFVDRKNEESLSKI